MQRPKQKKILILWFCLFTALCSCFNVRQTAANGCVQFYGDAVTAMPGDIITVPVKISENSGIMGFGLDVGFDEQIITPISTAPSGLLPVGGTFDDSITSKNNRAGSIMVFWAGIDNMKENGVLFYIKCKVSEQAAEDTKITLKLQKDNTFNEKYKNVFVKCRSIPVKISRKATGAASGQNRESGKEVIRHAAGEDTSGVPGRPVLKTVKKLKRNRLKLSWQSVANASGFQIQYAGNRTFTKNKKTIECLSTLKILNKIQKNKIYYIRVRAYQKKNEKRQYGAWSKIKRCQ